MRQFLNRLKRMWRGLWVRDLDQVKWILNEIDEFLSTVDDGHWANETLWSILSALRGPDDAVDSSHSFNLKQVTTAHIRKIAFPKTAESYHAPAMFRTQEEFNPEAAWNIGLDNHFYSHIRMPSVG